MINYFDLRVLVDLLFFIGLAIRCVILLMYVKIKLNFRVKKVM